MCSHGMFCGSGSFKRMAAEDDDDDQSCKTPRDASSPSPSSSPKGLKKKAGKNPYSGRGLDKFSSVMSELEARREQIMASAGPQGVAMVRFMHSNSDDWIPIVVRLRDHPTKETKRPAAAVDSQAEAPKEARVGPTTSTSAAKEKVMKKSFSWGSDNNDYNKKKKKNKNKKEGQGERCTSIWWSWRRGHNWVVMMVIILACLMVFGRVFAICCTSIWWYLVPTLKGEEEGYSIRRSMKKKDYGRRMSTNKGINI